MKPASRYPPQNISNPFAQLHPQPGPHQSSHLQHPNQSLQNHNFSNAHHAFASAGNQPSIFGPHGANGSSGVGSNLHAGFVTGGAGLGGAGGQAAQMGFAHNAASLQHMQQTHESTGALRSQAARIREVWKHNLEDEMATLRLLIDKYPYISMVRQNNNMTN
jgi:CCR4-NOT transcription complex subunit 7/8